MVIKGYRVGPLLKRTLSEVMDDNVLGLAAENAYYFFFSLFPIFLFLTPLLGVVGDKQKTMAFVIEKLSGSVPPDAISLVSNVLGQVVFSPNAPGVMSVGFLLALWGGSNIFSSLITALNAAYDVQETRPWWKTKLIAIAAVIVAGALFLLATTVLLAGEDIVNAVSNSIGLGATGRVVWNALQFPLAIAILVVLAWGAFVFLPNLRQSKKQAWVGALTTTFLWLAVTVLFRLYVQNFGSYNKTYGTIGAVIVLLTWMYLSMLTLLIGGELNSELHHQTGALNPHAGATLAGRIATGAGRPTSTERVERAVPYAASGRE